MLQSKEDDTPRNRLDSEFHDALRTLLLEAQQKEREL